MEKLIVFVYQQDLIILIKKVLDLLKKYGVKTIELGVQSSNDFILKKCKRGHNFNDVKKAAKLIRKNKFNLGVQMMVGLPESTQKDEIKTAKDLIKLRPKIARIYPVLVVKNTQLETEYLNGEYCPNTLEQAIETCSILLKMFEKKKVNVIRVGLQSTDEICEPENENSQVVAGPYHPAFRQLVESRILYNDFSARVKKMNSNIKNIDVRVNPQCINNFIGHKRENILHIKNIYDIDVNVINDENVKQYKIIKIS